MKKVRPITKSKRYYQKLYLFRRKRHVPLARFSQYLFDFVRLQRRQRIELRNKTERMGELFDWSALVKHYHAAHDLAMERVGAPKMGKFELKMV